MSLIDGWRHRVRTWLRRSRFESELSEEMRFHREMEERAQMENGADREEARYAARRAMGSEAWHRDEVRRVAGLERLDSIRQDVQYGLRVLSRSPGFALVVILTLALGIGVNLTIFGIVDSVVLHPLPAVPNTDRLVTVTSRSFSYPAYRDFQERTRSLAGLGGFRQRTLSLQHGPEPRLATVAAVTGNYFSLLGTQPFQGRAVTADDDRAEAPRVIVVSHAYWRRYMAEDPRALGSVVQVNRVPFTLVGITPPRFRGLEVNAVPDAWIPIAAWPDVAPSGFAGLTLETRGWSWMTMFGTLRPGTSLNDAEADLNRIATEIREAYPNETSSNFTVTLTPAVVAALPGSSRDGIIRFFTILLAVVAMVLLLASANVANLLLARTEHRHREIEVRLALGASRRRIARQLLTESLVLSGLAGIAAIGLMMLGLHLVRGFTFPGGMTIDAMAIRPNLPVVMVVFAATFLTGVFLGAVQIFHAVKSSSMTTLRQSGAAGRRGRPRIQGILLAAQVALSLVLLVGAGLFARSLQKALTLDPGFRTENILSVSVDLGLAHYSNEQAEQFYSEALDRVGRLSAVRSAAWNTAVLLTGNENVTTVGIDGYAPAESEEMVVEVNVVSRDFLPTMGIPLLKGSNFPANRSLGTRRNVIISEAMATRYWPGTVPIGRTIIAAGDTNTVIGIAKDARYHTLTDQPIPYLYLPLEGRGLGLGMSTINLLVRTTGDPDLLADPVRRELQAIAPQVPVFDILSVEETLNQLLLPQRTGVQLLGAFGLLALTVASIGVYGVVGYVVARRTKEVGIRMALGEEPAAVVWRMVKDNLGPIVVGLVVGSGLAVLLGRGLATFLYGINPADPITFAATTAILLVASVIAALLPARHASRVSPMVALRAE